MTLANANTLAELQERLRFEKLIADLSSRFVNLPPDRVDLEIEDALRRVCESLGLDLAALFQRSAESPHAYLMTHLYRPLGGPAVPERFDGAEMFPWSLQQLQQGRIVSISNLDSVSPAAARDQEAWRYYGIKSALAFPLSAGRGPLIGALGFHTVREERAWPDEIVNRLQLIAQIFTNALERKRADESLRESEERLSLAADSAEAGLWVLECQTNVFWGTERALAIFGFPSGQGISMAGFLAKVHPDDRELVRSGIERSVTKRQPVNVEYRIVTGDGRVLWVASRGQSYFRPNGEPHRVMGVTIDITERKRAEERLRESEARFRFVANSAPVMIWMADPDKLCTFFNKAWLDFTGRTLEQESGNGWSAGVHRDDLDLCLKTYVEAFDARQPFVMQYRLQRHDGEYRWLTDNGVPRYDAEGNFSGYIGSCVDFTERKLAEENWRLTVEASPSGIVLIDQQGRIVLVNAQTEKLFGYARAELIGQPVELLVPERLREDLAVSRARFMAAPQARPMGAGRELFARRKDGSEFPVEVGLNPIRTAEGMLLLGAIVDVTERKRAEAELQLQRMELAHVSRVSTLGELAGSLAHELNQPLTAILSNAQAALRFMNHERVDLDEVRDILQDIVEEDRRAGEVIRRLRGMLKKGESQMQPLDMNEAIQEVLRMMRSDLIARNVSVVTELSPCLPLVRGDRIQLQQVLLNLIINGCDAMHTTDAGERRLTISGETDGNGGVRVSVTDCGVGIAPEMLERIFEPFYSTKPHGLGMGLPICRSIVTAHGGRLWVERRRDRGATFHFTLTAHQEEKG